MRKWIYWVVPGAHNANRSEFVTICLVSFEWLQKHSGGWRWRRRLRTSSRSRWYGRWILSWGSLPSSRCWNAAMRAYSVVLPDGPLRRTSLTTPSTTSESSLIIPFPVVICDWIFVNSCNVGGGGSSAEGHFQTIGHLSGENRVCIRVCGSIGTNHQKWKWLEVAEVACPSWVIAFSCSPKTIEKEQEAEE